MTGFFAFVPILTFRTFEIVAGIASIGPFAWLIAKYLLAPLRVHFSESRLHTLQAERAYLRTLLSEIESLDRAAYWEDAFYTPLEAEAHRSHLVPPEFTTLKTPRGLSIVSRLPGWPTTGDYGRYERHKNILTIFARYKEPLVILGDPGSGKSVSFRHAIRQMIHHELRWYKTKPILPIYIPCSHYTDNHNGSPSAVTDFVANYLTTTASWSQHNLNYQSYLRAGRLVFLFDALDEMPRRDYVARLSQMNTFVAQHGNNRLFFSCRVFDYDRRLQIKEVYLRPFDRVRYHAFLKKQLTAHFSPQQLRTILYRLDTDPRLADLLSNPFFCQLLAFYIQALRIIPTSRYPLLSIYIEKCLERELARRSNELRSKEQTVTLLSQLAYLMSEAKGLGTAIPYHEATRMLSDCGVSAAEAKQLLTLALSARLLVLSSERSMLRFSHH